MRRVSIALLLAMFVLDARGQTRIASDVEIRQMEEEAARAGTFDAKVAVRVNLGELRNERNEPAAAKAEFEKALQIALVERTDAHRERAFGRYALACAWSGLALAGLRRGPESFAILEEAVRFGADSPGIWNLYSVAMFRLDRSDKAIGAARMSVSAAERNLGARSSVRELLELNVHRFALAQGLLNSKQPETQEAERILLKITESLESEKLESVRKSISKREAFEIVVAPSTESGIYLATYNRAHISLATLYESIGQAGKARGEYQAVLRRRSDESVALAGLARLATDPKERDRYLIQSLDANPFAADVVDAYQRLVQSGAASPAAATGSVGSRIRLAIQQIHGRDFRRARATLDALMSAHPNNNVLLTIFARAAVRSGDVATARATMLKIGDPVSRSEIARELRLPSAARPSFLDDGEREILDPSEAELRFVLSLFVSNTISAEDRATLDRVEFSGSASFDADAFESGAMNDVPFRFQAPARFRGIAATDRKLRVTYRILGATTVDDRDALLLEPIRAEVEK